MALQQWELELLKKLKAGALGEAINLVKADGKIACDAVLNAVEKVTPGWADALIETQREAFDKAVVDGVVALLTKLQGQM